MNVNKPYLPVITLQDILAFCPDDEQTHTSSRLVNAEVATHFGFSSLHALWRFFQTYTGETPEGLKSEAPRVDNYHKMVQEIRSRYR